jgi:hypothetical protein
MNIPGQASRRKFAPVRLTAATVAGAEADLADIRQFKAIRNLFAICVS